MDNIPRTLSPHGQYPSGQHPLMDNIPHGQHSPMDNIPRTFSPHGQYTPDNIPPWIISHHGPHPLENTYPHFSLKSDKYNRIEKQCLIKKNAKYDLYVY